MNYWQIAMTGMGVYTAGVGIAMGYMAWRDRKRKPLPPLPVRRYQPAHERPARQLSDCEEIKFGILWDSYYHLEAQDPMEQSGDR